VIGDTIEEGKVRVCIPCSASESEDGNDGPTYDFNVYVDITLEELAELNDPEYDANDWLQENVGDWGDYVDYAHGGSVINSPGLDLIEAGPGRVLNPGERAILPKHHATAAAVKLIMDAFQGTDLETFESAAIEYGLLLRCACGWNAPITHTECEECGAKLS
jgi:hypothetical protein